MNLDQLKKIAEAAEQQTAALTMTGPRCPWHDAPTLVAKLECADADADFIAAASPDVLLRLIAVARAGKDAEYALSAGLTHTLDKFKGEETSDSREMRKIRDALRSAIADLDAQQEQT